MPERREQEATRKRVDELAASVVGWQARVDSRYRIVVALSTVAVVLALGTAGLAWSSARGNQDALCALRHDLQDRVAVSERFLAEHPEGALGLSAKTIRTSLDGQRRTIRALSELSC